MKRSAPLLRLGILLYVIAWFLPVIKDGSTLADGVLPGWEAFRFALSTVIPYAGIRDQGHILHKAVCVASALTNFLMLLTLGWLASPAAQMRVRRLRWALAAAAAVNAYWLRGVPDLLLGYYCWFASFIVIAVVAFRMKAAEAGGSG